MAVIQLPGVNCEYETAACLERAGMDAEVFRWNRPAADLESFDAYVLPGGFSYQDRIRAGVVAAKAWRGGYAARSHTGVETGASYWHMVDLVWIVLFPLVYVMR